MIFSVPVRRKIVRTAELVHILEFSFLKYLFYFFEKVLSEWAPRISIFLEPNFMSFLARVMSFLNRGSDQFIPKFNHADVILTILIWMMTHLIYWRIRRFEIISISVVWRLLRISESFLEKIWVISRRYDVTVIQQGEFQKSYQSFSQMGLLQRCLATFGFVSK